ncbi:RNA polymerase sigma factor [Streptomyces sp. HC44]|uniref:RNA polymerase sigma factor n=1 Tax=Streptomyces scabichelini TaxID=2711217 RepID=A0A6G4UZH1_9ACTN|nr:RNA polymerase sigma factor [Streptomyces scabichelini]
MELSLRARIRAGDPQAFAELFGAHARAVYSHAARLTGDRGIAEDVVSLTFLEAWRLREKLRPDAPEPEEGDGLRPWLYGIATNVLRNTRRAAQYVYVRTQGSQKIMELGTQIFRRSDWTAVDGKRSGLARITVLSGPNLPGHQAPKGTPEDMTLSADPNVTTYRELEALPTDPDALLKKIYADTEGQGPTQEEAVLEAIGDMLDDAMLLPELDAALYRAAAKIPGVRVVENAKDFAGRPGIGLSFKEHDENDVWVFDKKSLNYLGSNVEALLGVGVVDKVGDEPKS